MTSKWEYVAALVPTRKGRRRLCGYARGEWLVHKMRNGPYLVTHCRLGRIPEEFGRRKEAQNFAEVLDEVDWSAATLENAREFIEGLDPAIYAKAMRAASFEVAPRLKDVGGSG